MLACVPTLGPSAPAPTFDPNSINTVIVETANAAKTQTALFTTPSSTPTAIATFTRTPTETQTVIPTILILLATPTIPSSTPQASGAQFGCQVVSQSPVNGFGFSADIEFTTTWQVLNTGKNIWDSNSADVSYLSGDKLHLQKAYDLEKNVGPGEQYTVTVKMKAPSQSGTYTTTWAIKTKSIEYCRMSLTIKV